ncbi:hypothetical protein BIT28_18865 [Photobacterium proteolyticum]|uniref:Carrier domain-containing protein n=1 Tax=Photobacterium proteolyticum TaxID=1903952 RepID=A0A1Q9GN44_9GAMM|nr:acyl carrier protein [Photobacterium proteolyticum]OLQ76080.1 hypothetical protein BIT28_18865 [Photobacterium proteolyticum]
MSSEQSVIKIVSEILEIDSNDLTIDTTIDDIAVWDSMATVNIMTVVCQEFGIVPSFDDFEHFTSINGIVSFMGKVAC